jgi:hypothetical protein
VERAASLCRWASPPTASEPPRACNTASAMALHGFHTWCAAPGRTRVWGLSRNPITGICILSPVAATQMTGTALPTMEEDAESRNGKTQVMKSNEWGTGDDKHPSALADEHHWSGRPLGCGALAQLHHGEAGNEYAAAEQAKAAFGNTVGAARRVAITVAGWAVAIRGSGRVGARRGDREEANAQ